jgi:hypothetical protein
VTLNLNSGALACYSGNSVDSAKSKISLRQVLGAAISALIFFFHERNRQRKIESGFTVTVRVQMAVAVLFQHCYFVKVNVDLLLQVWMPFTARKKPHPVVCYYRSCKSNSRCIPFDRPSCVVVSWLTHAQTQLQRRRVFAALVPRQSTVFCF